jgi:hypothetical protein
MPISTFLSLPHATFFGSARRPPHLFGKWLQPTITVVGLGSFFAIAFGFIKSGLYLREQMEENGKIYSILFTSIPITLSLTNSKHLQLLQALRK